MARTALAIALVLTAPGTASAAGWTALPAAPQARTEVVSAVVGGRIAVAGGLTANGISRPRVDLFDPARGRWSRLPDLPVGLNHALAAARGQILYVLGGYRPDATFGPLHTASRRVFALRLRADGRAAGAWAELPRLPAARAAGGAAIIGDTLYVMGGTRAVGVLARTAYALDLGTRRWRQVPGPPTRREHLGVAALGRRVYVLGGRTAGLESNLRTAEAWDTASHRWVTLPLLPSAHGGCAAAAFGGRVVLVGGEGPAGTIPAVAAYSPTLGAWRDLPELPRPRHGLGVAAVGRRLYVLLGGPQPGLTVSKAVDSLRL